MSAHRTHLTLARRILTALLLLSLLGAWSPRPVARAEQTQIPAAEYAALVALYNSTDGPNWTNKWTLPTDDPCGLYGVRCSSGHVIGLLLGSNGLTGAIPPELGSLSNLTWLDLSHNQLAGAIPGELCNLADLRELNLGYNQLTGTIPASIGSLSNLTSLRLDANQLTDAIPASLGNLSNLTSLYLRMNQLTGVIPPELGNLPLLQDLDLLDNKLSGTIPASLANLSNLTRLDLSGNNLTGSIPSSLGNLSKLTWLILGWNQLTGGIPSELGNLTLLQSLGLYYNELTGPIPSSLGNLTNLTYLHLGGNQLTGAIPSELGDLPLLLNLFLYDNQLSGAIPASLGTLTALEYLHLDGNAFSGVIPSSLGGLANLRSLVLSHNALQGPVPATLATLTQLGIPLYEWDWPVVDFGYNLLWTDDPAVTAFLNEKDPDWAATQGVADAVTPSDGGELTLDAPDGSSLMVTVPAGGVTEATTLVLIPAEGPNTAPGTLTFAGQAFRLEAYREGLLAEPFAFEKPVTLSVTYTDAQIAGLDEASLALYVWEDPAWIDAATTCTPASSYVREPEINRLSVDICHLSEYALFGVQTDPYPFKVYLPLVKR